MGLCCLIHLRVIVSMTSVWIATTKKLKLFGSSVTAVAGSTGITISLCVDSIKMVGKLSMFFWWPNTTNTKRCTLDGLAVWGPCLKVLTVDDNILSIAGHGGSLPGPALKWSVLVKVASM